MKYLILDVASSEVNRGSFCYMPYILHAALDHAHENSARLIEDFTIAQMDDLDLADVDEVLVGLWSYPQIETCLAIWRLWSNPEIPVSFFGYEPLIDDLGLPKCQPNLALLSEGLAYYPGYVVTGAYRHILLSDCDAHLKSGGDVKVYPMFTSYGCPRKCKFCSASKNTHGNRIVLQENLVFKNLDKFIRNGVEAVHFTDEDFFFNTGRAVSILSYLYDKNPNFQCIALGHASTFYSFYNFVQEHNLLAKMRVLKLVEIGLETADEKQANLMGKCAASRVDILPEIGKNRLCKVLWLTMTFYPGDSVNAINATGRFLEKYGLNPDEMCERIRTNGTVGGLGQFYQFYHGCADYDRLLRYGTILTDRPMRLLPSYLPDTFLNRHIECVLEVFDKRVAEALLWAKYNHISQSVMLDIIGTMRAMTRNFTPSDFISPQATYIGKAQVACAIAILARLGMITEQSFSD